MLPIARKIDVAAPNVYSFLLRQIIQSKQDCTLMEKILSVHEWLFRESKLELRNYRITHRGAAPVSTPAQKALSRQSAISIATQETWICVCEVKIGHMHWTVLYENRY